MISYLGLRHCRLLWSGEVVIDERWRHPLYDPFWRFYRNRDEGAVITSEDRRWPLAAGRCYLVPSWSRVSSTCRGRVRHTYLHFEPVGLSRQQVQARQLGVIELSSSPLHDTLLATIPIRSDTPYATCLRWQVALCTAMLEVLGSEIDLDPAGDPAGNAVMERLAPVLRHVDRHLATPLPVAELADLCDLGREHFARLFTRAMGVSPAHYVQERRIATAAERLLCSEEGIEAIAEAVGFANRYHFTRVFRRILRITPARYRRQGRL